MNQPNVLVSPLAVRTEGIPVRLPGRNPTRCDVAHICYGLSMARSYRDAVELIVGPLPVRSAVTPDDAVVIVGAITIGAVDPVPVVLLPGWEYRIRSFLNEADRPGEHVWVIGRRRVSQSVTRRENGEYREDDE